MPAMPQKGWCARWDISRVDSSPGLVSAEQITVWNGRNSRLCFISSSLRSVQRTLSAYQKVVLPRPLIPVHTINWPASLRQNRSLIAGMPVMIRGSNRPLCKAVISSPVTRCTTSRG
jgi:hypothetical protein